MPEESSNDSILTNASDGSLFTRLASQYCRRITIFNDTGVNLEARQFGDDVIMTVFPGTIYTFQSITNADQIEVRRFDQSNVAVEVKYRWEMRFDPNPFYPVGGLVQVADGSITEVKLGEEAVTTSKLADESVTAAKVNGADKAAIRTKLEVPSNVDLAAEAAARIAGDAAIADDLSTHEARTDNPHAVTKTQVGLGSVDNTADDDKPVSTAQQAAIDVERDARITIDATKADTDLSNVDEDSVTLALLAQEVLDLIAAAGDWLEVGAATELSVAPTGSQSDINILLDPKGAGSVQIPAANSFDLCLVVTGFSQLLGGVYSDGDGYFAGQVTGDGGLSVTGTSNLAGDVNITGAGSDLQVGGATNLNGTLNVNLTSNFNGAQTLAGATSMTNASVTMSALPTSDPAVAGRLWNDTGTLKISAG